MSGDDVQSPSNFITSLTVPTGATTGPRVVLANGALITYDGSSGGKYGAGIFTELSNGNLYTGSVQADGTTPDVNNAGGLSYFFSGAPSIVLSGPEDLAAGLTHTPFVSLLPGSSVARIVLSDSQNATLKLEIGGYASYQNETWHNVTLNGGGGWVGTTSYNGLGGGHQLAYRREVEDDVWLNGLVAGGVSPGTTVGTLPAGYRPTSNQFGNIVFEDGGGGSSAMNVVVTTAGNIIVERSVAAARAYSFNFRFPLGNLT